MSEKEKHKGIDTLPFDLFARIADDTRPEKPEDHVEDWSVILDEFAAAISGDANSPATALEAQIRSLYVKQARYQILLAMPKTEALQALMKAEGITPNSEANINMQIAMKEGALARLTGADADGKAKEAPKYADYIRTLLSIGRLHKVTYNPRKITTLEYCLLYSDASAESKAIEAATKTK